MRVGIDVSSVVYGTGVSQYTLELIRHLPEESTVPVGFSLRRQAELSRLIPHCSIYPIPPSVLHVLWNKFHVLSFDNFIPGHFDIYHSSDWAQAPSKALKVTTVHDLAPFLFPTETSSQIVATHTARMHWVVKECAKIIC